MNHALNFRVQYKATVQNYEVEILRSGNDAPWIWKIRNLYRLRSTVVGKPVRDLETARQQVEAWLAEQPDAR